VRVRFRTEAADDVSLAREWYDAQSPGLGDSFVGSLEQIVDLVGELVDIIARGNCCCRVGVELRGHVSCNT
jgi:hypothetical protein